MYSDFAQNSCIFEQHIILMKMNLFLEVSVRAALFFSFSTLIFLLNAVLFSTDFQNLSQGAVYSLKFHVKHNNTYYFIYYFSN